MSYSLKVDLWRTLSNEAWKNKRRPAIRIEFTQAEALIVLDESTFEEILNALGEQYEI